MTSITQYELKKLRRIAAEAVRREIGYDDWMDDCVPRLIARGEDEVAATVIASNIWKQALEEDRPVRTWNTRCQEVKA